MLSAYHICTGPLDVMKSLSMMGLGVDQSYEQSFYRNMKTMNVEIISTCEDINEESFLAEVSATMKAVAENQDLTPDEKNDFDNTKNVEKIDNVDLTQFL